MSLAGERFKRSKEHGGSREYLGVEGTKGSLEVVTREKSRAHDLFPASSTRSAGMRCPSRVSPGIIGAPDRVFSSRLASEMLRVLCLMIVIGWRAPWRSSWSGKLE